MNKIALACLFCSLGCFALGLDEESAKTKAKDFAQRFQAGSTRMRSDELHAHRTSGSRNVGPRWRIASERYNFVVDDASGEILLFTDLQKYGDAVSATRFRDRGAPFFRSSADVADRARARLNNLGITFGPDVEHHPLPEPAADGMISRQLIGVLLSEHPNGYPTNGNGNIVTVELDSLTGEVIEIERRTGYAYEAPNVRVSQAEARQSAGASIDLPLDAVVRGPMYVQLSPSWQPDARASALIGSRTLPLVYEVRGKDKSALIATDTGEVLASYENATAGSGTTAAGAATSDIRLQVPTYPGKSLSPQLQVKPMWMRKPNERVISGEAAPSSSGTKPLMIAAIGGIVFAAIMGVFAFFRMTARKSVPIR